MQSRKQKTIDLDLLKCFIASEKALDTKVNAESINHWKKTKRPIHGIG